MIGYSKRNRKNIEENAFERKKKKPRIKFNPIAFEQLGPGVQVTWVFSTELRSAVTFFGSSSPRQWHFNNNDNNSNNTLIIVSPYGAFQG